MVLKKLLVFTAFGLLYLLGCGDSFAEQPRDGDIIFQTSRSEQSIAIQKATHSQYSHMGIVFLRSGTPHVYEAIKTVQYTPLRKWIDRGEGGHYVAKRLREANRILTSQALKKLRQAGTKFQGIVGLGSKLHYTLCSYAEMKTEGGQVFCLAILG